ncbi:MAG: HAMP domain-containing sensor histidine kinase [Candidatus Eisenbacteria bacterium]
MERRRPWLYFAICALGLPLYLFAFQHQAREATLSDRDLPPGFSFPARIGLREGAQEVTAWEVASAAELRLLAEGRTAGTPVVLTPAGNGNAFHLSLPRNLSLAGIAITLVSGLFFWGVSAFVFASRAHSGTVRSFFWCTFLYGQAIMIGGIRAPGSAEWTVILLGIAQLAALAALPVIFVHLTLNFPRRQPVLDRYPLLMRAMIVLAAVLVAWQGYTFLRYVHSPRPDLFRTLAVPLTIADGVLVAEVLAGLFVLGYTGRSLELTRERAQSKWLLWGFAVGVTPYVFLRTLPQLAGLRPPFGPGFDRLFEMAIPIAFIFAVVRYRFLDIDIIIRRSVIYASLAGLMTALYLGFSIFLGRFVEELPPARSLAVAIAIGTGAGVMFQPLRRMIGRAVDQTFFKLSHGYGRALTLLAHRLADVHGQADLARMVDEFLAQTLDVRDHAVLLEEKGEWLGYGNVGAVARFAGRLAADCTAFPGSTSMPEVECERFPAELAAAGFVLQQTVRAGSVRAGIILLGRKHSERRFVEPDLELIHGAAAEAGRSLERIRLIQTADEQAHARQRAEEMDRLKGEFLSRVAHDLRTPLASIAWSTDNLLDGIAGTLAPQQIEYLRSMKASAGHLSRLITNILEISRLERGATTLDLAPVQLGTIVEEALLTIRPLADAKRLSLAYCCGDDRPVHGNAEKLLEVVLNLLENAIRFSPAGGGIEIETLAGRAAETGSAENTQVLTVRDHGPGFGDIDPPLLFERFRQGARSPHAQQQGFGLGLHIVKSYVTLMRGTVEARNHPAGGALFTVTLPLAQPPAIHGKDEA